MSQTNKTPEQKFSKIPFVFEVLLCSGLLLLYRVSFYWTRFFDYSISLHIIWIIIDIWVLSVIIFLGLKYQKRTLASVLVFKKVNYKIWLAMAVLSIGFILFGFYIDLLFISFKWGWYTNFEPNYNYIYDANLLLLIIDIAIIPAIFEEIMMKGVIYNSLRKKWSKIIAVIVSSILFAALHLNLIMFVPHLLFSLFTFWVYFMTGSLIFPIIIHFIWNLFVTVIDWRHFGDISVFYSSLLLFLIGIYLLNKAIKSDKTARVNTPWREK